MDLVSDYITTSLWTGIASFPQRMMRWKEVVSFFSIQTLDARFLATKSKPIGDNNVQQPPRWKTVEFTLYYCILIPIVPLMFWQALSVSQVDSPNYLRYENLLEPGWIPGRMIDNSDLQYRSFRNNIPLLVGVITLHLALRRLFSLCRVYFDVAFGILFLTVLHGVSISQDFDIGWSKFWNCQIITWSLPTTLLYLGF